MKIEQGNVEGCGSPKCRIAEARVREVPHARLSARGSLDPFAATDKLGLSDSLADMDTDAITRARVLELLKGISPPERMGRALALSALVRDLAWQGAVRHAGHLGAAAVVDRFLRQLYGAEFATWVTRERGALDGD